MSFNTSSLSDNYLVVMLVKDMILKKVINTYKRKMKFSVYSPVGANKM
jgi:hypothetical protein